IYRLGLMDKGGTQLLANFETTPPVKTNCMQQSKRTLPLRPWSCIEWHMEVATNEMQFWIDGHPITHVKERATVAGACAGHDLDDRWLGTPRRAPARARATIWTAVGWRRRASTVSTWASSVMATRPTIRICGSMTWH